MAETLDERSERLWARRIEADLKGWEEPVAPTEQWRGQVTVPKAFTDQLANAMAPKPWWVRWSRVTMRYLSNLWSALRGEGL